METKTGIWKKVFAYTAVVLLVCAACATKIYMFMDRSGWDTESGVIRYLDSEGDPLLGWQELEEACYYFDPDDGSMATG